MIALKDVGVSVGGKDLLTSVWAELPRNALTAIIGPNGAGKSTLLNAMAGGISPTSGSVAFDGFRLANMRRFELAQRRAVLSQNLELPFPLKVEEVVALGRALKADTEVQQQRVIAAALERARASELAERVFSTLSGGERQRVHFARVLAQLWEPIERGEPATLLLDEPTSAMDMHHQHLLLEQLQKLARNGLTVCCVLHDLNLAALFADHVWALKNGRLHASGPTDEVFDDRLLSDIYEMPLVTINHPQRASQVVVAYAMTG
ncbi:heme ABC transporter ATP-binding protein [Porticoccus sp. W117]|uniref:heme ABC transporter ATP-binding protein n=1 Tax=Porticoccus sp. W117 TaxID=3054777 RepID=UPI002598956D|nr:heme ABC transporter ATP-binding protein [Porticoccus sp. W117]MDM3871621.1 heme ABC transporter ATP-binding protein [Porticoccus sp. W117]